MDHDFFRPESETVINGQAFGRVSIAAPPSHSAWTLFALSIVIGLLTFGWFGQSTRRERVPGMLVPQAGQARVLARNGGTLVDLLVHEGDKVHARQPLLSISGERNIGVTENFSDAMSQSIRARDAALAEEISGSSRFELRQKAYLRDSESLLKQQLSHYTHQVSLMREKAATFTGMLEKIRPLVAKGYVSQLQAEQQKSELLMTRAEIDSLERQRVELEQQLADIKRQALQLPISSRAKISSLDRQRHQLAEESLDNEVSRLTTAVASIDGTVSSLLSVQGDTVTPGQPLLTILPSNSPLEADLLVPSSAIGFIKRGTSVSLHVAAFPYQKFGIQTGHVIEISRSPISTSAVASMGGDPLAMSKSQYRVRVALDRQTVTAYGHKETLLPGMETDADLMLESRTLAEWIFEPLEMQTVTLTRKPS